MDDIMKLQNGSDIRGIALEGVEGENVNLTPERAGAIASAYVEWLAHKVNKNPFELKICVGADPRLSGDALKESIKAGVCIMGSKVFDAGLASTPAMFMSLVMPFWDFDGSIMITASHLPYNRNGLKFFTASGGLEKEDITSILTKAAKVSFVGEWSESEDVNLMDMYAATLRQYISNELHGDLKGMKIAIDAGNGSGGFFAKNVLEKLGADISASQFLEPDGHFPNHEPNPENKDAMKSICDRVVETGADLGIIFDTDVDRSAAVAPDGKPISRNEIVAMAASLGASEHPGGTVVTDSITSNELNEYLEKELGLKHLRYKRGYRNVINKAQELREQGEDAFLAIETSGHAAFSDNFFLDDGAFLAVLITIAAAKLKREGKTIYSQIEKLKTPAESREIRYTILCDDYQAFGAQVLDKLEDWVKNQEGFAIEEPNYEGVRVNFDKNGVKGWFLMRKSLHDPVLPFNIETDTIGGCDIIMKDVDEFMKEFDEQLEADKKSEEQNQEPSKSKKDKKGKKEKKPKKPMTKAQRTISTILLVFFIGVAIFSAIKLFPMLYDYWKLRMSNKKAVELAYNGEFTGIIDFDKLREQNSEVVGWLYHKDMKIDLPIVQTDNNDTYLSKRFDGTYGGGGTIFVDYQVENPFNDFNTIIYGHHMKDGSMFAPFKKFKSMDYGVKNKRFELITPDAKYHLDTVAFLNVASDDSVYTVNITTPEYKSSYCQEIANKASYTTGVEFGPDDRLVLLSTCAYEFDNARWIIVGKLVPWTDDEIAKAEKLQKAKEKSEAKSTNKSKKKSS